MIVRFIRGIFKLFVLAPRSIAMLIRCCDICFGAAGCFHLQASHNEMLRKVGLCGVSHISDGFG